MDAASDCLTALKTAFRVGFADSKSELLEAQRLRYQVFCHEHHILDGHDGIESDEFDDHSRHVVIRRRDGEPVGTARLVLPLATARGKSFPIQKVVAPALLTSLPVERTGEISRFALSRERRENNSRTDALLRLGLMKGLLQASREAGVTHWCAAMEVSLLRLLRTCSIHFEPVGGLIDYRGLRQPAVACIDDILARGLRERPAFWDFVTDGGRFHLAQAADLAVAA